MNTNKKIICKVLIWIAVVLYILANIIAYALGIPVSNSLYSAIVLGVVLLLVDIALIIYRNSIHPDKKGKKIVLGIVILFISFLIVFWGVMIPINGIPK